MRKIVTIENDDGDEVYNREYDYKLFDFEKGYKLKSKSKTMTCYIDQGKKIRELLSNKTDLANMLILALQMYKDTNMICKYTNHKYRPATIDDIADILDMCLRRTIEFVKKMMDLKVMAKVIVQTGSELFMQYYINPLYFKSCKSVPAALYVLFQKDLDKHLPPHIIAEYHDCLYINKCKKDDEQGGNIC